MLPQPSMSQIDTFQKKSDDNKTSDNHIPALLLLPRITRISHSFVGIGKTELTVEHDNMWLPWQQYHIIANCSQISSDMVAFLNIKKSVLT